VKQRSQKESSRSDESARTESGWLPIETAPRDGSWFIAYRPLAMKTNDHTFEIVQGVKHPTTSPQGVVHYTDRWCHPTHWMPLPEVPKP
jgi:hypothetical protein